MLSGRRQTRYLGAIAVAMVLAYSMVAVTAALARFPVSEAVMVAVAAGAFDEKQTHTEPVADVERAQAAAEEARGRRDLGHAHPANPGKRSIRC